MEKTYLFMCLLFALSRMEAQFTVGITNPKCSGDCDGSVQITPSNPYSFHWNNGDTLSEMHGLCAGTYTCIISDSMGAILDTIGALLDQAIPATYEISSSNVSCNDAKDGVVNIQSFTNILAPFIFALGKNGSNFIYSDIGSFTSLDSGLYTVIAIDAHGCTDTSSIYIAQSDTLCTTEIADVTNSFGFSLSPNPASDALQIEVHHVSSNFLQISIMDISGQTLSHQIINPAVKNEMDVSGLGAGLYFVVLQDENERVVRKFVKE